MKKIIHENLKPLMLVLFFILFCICYLSQVSLKNTGDGSEYILQVISIQNHFSSGISEQDMLQAKAEFYNEANGLESAYSLYIEKNPYNGKAYCNHYGFYSLLVLPIKLIIQFIGVYPLWAFPITNLILWVAALLVVVLCMKTTLKNKICILLLSMINPAFFYLTWIHTEIYIFSFTIIGLVFFYNKQYGRSILSLSFAAMQNVAIVPFAMIVGLDYIIRRISLYKEKSEEKSLIGFVRQDTKKIVPYGFLYIPALLPLVSTYVRFGTFSLVADEATENEYLLHKALDYLFDLNIGIMPYMPIILVLFIIMLIKGVKKCTELAIVNFLGIGGIFFIISNQKQINCGMQAIMRYNVWIIPIMIFFVVMAWNSVFNKINKSQNIIVASELAISAFVITCVYTIGGSFSYLEFAPWTETIMDLVPQLYNPTHGIFYSRTLGYEIYDSEEPVVYMNEDGYARKILLSKEAEEIFYSDECVIIDDLGNVIDKSGLNIASVDQGDYKYVNINDDYYMAYKYELGTDIWFYTDNYNADRYVVKGISNKEEWGSWTNGSELVFYFYVENVESNYLNLYLEIADVYNGNQNIKILVNDEEMYEDELNGAKEINLYMENPDTKFIKVSVELPDAISPSDVVTGSSDSRLLSLALKRMNISEANSNYSTSGTETYSDIFFYSEKYNASEYVVEGLSEPEELFSWTDGYEVKMVFLLDEVLDSPINIYIDVYDTYYQSQEVSILINDELVYENTIIGDQDIEFSAELTESELLELSILLPDAISPSEVKESDDGRTLGLALKQMRIS